MSADFIVIVPDGHPMAGAEVVVYPASGATTYIEGEMRVISASAYRLDQALRSLRQTLAELDRRKLGWDSWGNDTSLAGTNE